MPAIMDQEVEPSDGYVRIVDRARPGHRDYQRDEWRRDSDVVLADQSPELDRIGIASWQADPITPGAIVLHGIEHVSVHVLPNPAADWVTVRQLAHHHAKV